MNVSGIVVKTKVEHLPEVIENVNAVDFCEVHFYDSEGKIVVTVEGESIDEQMKRLKHIQSMPFVLSAHLAYSYCEDELVQSYDQITELRNTSHYE